MEVKSQSTVCLGLSEECLTLTEQKHKSPSAFSPLVWRIIHHSYCPAASPSRHLLPRQPCPFLLQAVRKGFILGCSSCQKCSREGSCAQFPPFCSFSVFSK